MTPDFIADLLYAVGVMRWPVAWTVAMAVLALTPRI